MSTNPKATLIRNTGKALAATFRRAFGEAGRTLVNPAATLEVRNGLEATLGGIIVSELTKTGLPVVTPTDPIPEGAHWLYEALGGRRNFLHGRLPVSVQMAYVDETGTCPIGAVYFPVEDVLAIAEKGTGASGPERLRTGGRKELTDAMLLLPWNSGDCAKLRLMELADTHTLHTRKTGHTLFDAIDVAAGRADLLVATRLNRLEALLAPLILAESGAMATEIGGAPLTGQSTTLIAGNLKIQPELVKLLGKPQL
jgi:fructose-1,6-bisphosphatase/inositol monophosphatase family enzyme